MELQIRASSKNFTKLHHDVVDYILASEKKKFSKENIDKALCVSGHKDKESTLKWLYSHSNDPTLNQQYQREYIIFLCPTGPLLSEVSKFYETSFNKCGANSAHNLFPHVTLTSFFKVNDAILPCLLDILKDTVQTSVPKQPTKLKLVLQRSEGYIGLFLTEQALLWLTETLNTFVKRVDTELGIQIKPQDRQFHLTLAYNFDHSKTEDLEILAKKINVDAPARWELNIYSRDPRFNGKQFQLAMYDFKGSETDELDLRQNAHVIMDPDGSQHKGWKKGIDFDTGKVGYFPENFTKKTAEWRVWTKNISIPITHTSEKHSHHASSSSSTNHDERSTNNKAPRRSQSVNFKKDRNKQEHLRSSLRATSISRSQQQQQQQSERGDKSDKKAGPSAGWEHVVRASTAINPNIANHMMRQRSFDSPKSLHKTQIDQRHSNPLRTNSNDVIKLKIDVDKRRRVGGEHDGTNRRVFVMRHAERVDLTFGHDWFRLYIDDKGYHRRNLNLPRRIPTRRGGPKDFFTDGPISEIGTFQAKLIGEALRAKGVSFSAVYASPSLRSVQTAASVLEGLSDNSSKIKIEPALFEWMSWCRNILPKFMTPDEYIEYGINVDRSYIPYFPYSQFNLHETTDDYYYRSHSFVDSTLKTAKENILLVGHSASLDVCSRQLIGQPIRKTADLIRVVQKVPFCGMCTLEEKGVDDWQLIQTPIPSLAHGQNQTFDYRVLESTATGPPYTR